MTPLGNWTCSSAAKSGYLESRPKLAASSTTARSDRFRQISGCIQPCEALLLGEEKEKIVRRPDFPPDRPLTADQLAALRQQYAKLSITGLYDAYFAAWQRCKVERDGRAPRAGHIQELVQVWKELRKLGKGT
jgi:hypothetical protein